MTSRPKEEDSHSSRENETREAESRETAWLPPSVLPEPHQRPGLVHRWVRTSTMGQADPVNLSQSFREGWTPVNAAEYPELKILSDHGTRWPDGVEVGGLLLCSAPVGQIKQIREYYRSTARRQMKSVHDQLEAEEDPRFRTISRSHDSNVTRGFGPPMRRERNGPNPPE